MLIFLMNLVSRARNFSVIILFAVPVIALQDKDNSHGDIFSLGIEEQECEQGLPVPDICEVRNISKTELIGLKVELEKNVNESEYLINYESDVLTISVLNPKQRTFICCDIQSPLREYKLDDRTNLRAAKFLIPSEAFIEIALLGGPTTAGPTKIFDKIDSYQSIYLQANENSSGLNDIEVFYIPDFDRAIYLFKPYSSEVTPEYIFYFKDGQDVSFFTKAIKKFHENNGSEIPNIALVGVASGVGDLRRDEYLKFSSKDKDAFQTYQNSFSNIIVPTIEKKLNFDKGSPGRVLIGKSNGGSWALNYSLDNPDFTCNILVLSPGGKVPSIEPTDTNDCRHYFVGVGRYEGSFTIKANSIVESLKGAQFQVQNKVRQSGHSFASWTPIFLEYYEQVFLNSILQAR